MQALLLVQIVAVFKLAQHDVAYRASHGTATSLAVTASQARDVSEQRSPEQNGMSELQGVLKVELDRDYCGT